jgi:hypothetical protein
MITLRRSNVIALGLGFLLLYLNLRSPDYLGFDWPLLGLMRQRTVKAQEVARDKAEELVPELAASLCSLPPVSALQEQMAQPYIQDDDAENAAVILGQGCEVLPGVWRWPRLSNDDLQVVEQ